MFVCVIDTQYILLNINLIVIYILHNLFNLLLFNLLLFNLLLFKIYIFIFFILKKSRIKKFSFYLIFLFFYHILY